MALSVEAPERETEEREPCHGALQTDKQAEAKEMDQVITFTLEEVWHLILAICGGIVAISGAVAVIVQLVKKAKHPNQKQNERIGACEKAIADLKEAHKRDVSEIKARLEEGTHQFEAEDERTRELEEDLKTTIKMILEVLQALTAHAIDDTNTDELLKAKKNLDTFLREKV